VPKFDIILKPGEPLPEEFAPILNRRLSPALREKLLKHGGLVRLSVASPYADRKEAKTPIVVDDTFIAGLEASAKVVEEVRARLQPLAIKHLLEICARLRLPVRSKASSRELREAIVQGLQSGHFWQKISGSQQHPPGTASEKRP
jgi:hypothetical protein